LGAVVAARLPSGCRFTVCGFHFCFVLEMLVQYQNMRIRSAGCQSYRKCLVVCAYMYVRV